MLKMFFHGQERGKLIHCAPVGDGQKQRVPVNAPAGFVYYGLCSQVACILNVAFWCGGQYVFNVIQGSVCPLTPSIAPPGIAVPKIGIFCGSLCIPTQFFYHAWSPSNWTMKTGWSVSSAGAVNEIRAARFCWNSKMPPLSGSLKCLGKMEESIKMAVALTWSKQKGSIFLRWQKRPLRPNLTYSSKNPHVPDSRDQAVQFVKSNLGFGVLGRLKNADIPTVQAFLVIVNLGFGGLCDEAKANYEMFPHGDHLAMLNTACCWRWIFAHLLNQNW